MKKKNEEKKNKEEQELKSDASAENDQADCDKEGEDNGSNETQGDVANNDETLKSEDEGLQNKMLRLQADFINYKNRTEKEKTATYGNAVADVLKDLLSVIDNFERAIEVEATDAKSFKEGVVMIFNQFTEILIKKGLKEIEAIDTIFDPNIHYGVAFDSESEKDDGTVIEVFQKGYAVNERVIRPSMVKIVKK